MLPRIPLGRYPGQMTAATARPQVLILDCDGVLIRSERANVAYYNHLFAHFDLPTLDPDSAADVRRVHTLSTPQVIDAYVPERRRAEAQRFAAVQAFEPFLPYLAPEPGWSAVLGWWRALGRVAVATNRGSSAGAVLGHVGLAPLVDLVVTVKDVARPKPFPDMLLKVVAHFGVSPGACLYVGDSDLDREAASGAGVPFLGFRHPAPPSVDSAEGVATHLRALAAEPASATLQGH